MRKIVMASAATRCSGLLATSRRVLSRREPSEPSGHIRPDGLDVPRVRYPAVPPAAWMAFVVLSVFLLLAPAGGALAYYGDGETSSGNGLGATALDFTLRDAGGVVTDTLFEELDIAPDPDWYVEPLEIRKETGLDFDYEAWFEKTGGDDALCGALQLKARQDGVLVYSGPLDSFTYDAGVISGGQDDWSFEILFDNEDASFENLSCQFDFVYRGEQAGGAGFYDEERVSNVFATGEWGAGPGDVVINEIMWMGSTESSYDEWIELRNTTDQEINVGQWEIENARESEDPALMIPAGKTIPAGGYLLIANYPEEANPNSVLNVPVDVVNASLSLANAGNGNLVLRDRYGNVVDEAKGDEWPEGYNSGGFKKSMERNDTPGDGTLAESWHTCLDDDGIDGDCNDGTFWDTDDGDDYGTPGAANLSEGDPTSLDELSAYAEASADRRGAGPTSGGAGNEEPAGEGDDVVDAVVEPIETGGGREGSTSGGSDVDSGVVGSVDENNGDTADDGSDGDNEVVWLGSEENDVAGIGGAGEGYGEGDDPTSPDGLRGAGEGDGNDGDVDGPVKPADAGHGAGGEGDESDE